MEQRQEIRFIATNFPNLQGLRVIPLSLMLFAATLWADMQRGPARDLAVPIAVFIIGAALFWLIDRYYSHFFGRVKRKPKERLFEGVIGLVAAGLALGAFVVDTSAALPVSLTGLVFGGMVLGDYVRMTWVVKGRHLLFYPVLALVILIASILPMLGVTTWWRGIGLREQLSAVLLVCSVALMLAGILTHLSLTRLLPDRER